MRTTLSAVIVGGLACASPAAASFHLMQIEQVVGGLAGDTSQQAIQLRLRMSGQNLVQSARIRAWDAAGANPVLIIDMTTNVANGAAGARILIASPNLMQCYGGTPADFTMTNIIPASYLPAGSLTFEADEGTVYWRLSWGGAGYSGPGTGVPVASGGNDADGNFNPPFPGPLSSTTSQAVRFTGPASALSTNNAADYALTPGASVFTANSGASSTLAGGCPCCLPNGNCTYAAGTAQCLAAGGTFAGGDCPVTTCAATCPADIAPWPSGNNAVNIDDLLAVISNWGPCPAPPAPCPANIVTSGSSTTNVDIDDLLAVISAWGPCP